MVGIMFDIRNFVFNVMSRIFDVVSYLCGLGSNSMVI